MRKELIALDGAHGPRVAEVATLLVDALTARQARCGVSRWDASGLFGDVVSAPVGQRHISPRTLLLLYAADLAFRLRWEIAPALESGMIVIAAPYVQTAISFGLGAGLSGDWLRTLLRFAPEPSRTVVLRERTAKRVWKRRPDRGFGECCTTLLETTALDFDRHKTRAAMYEVLTSAADKRGGLFRKRDLGPLADELTRRRSNRVRGSDRETRSQE